MRISQLGNLPRINSITLTFSRFVGSSGMARLDSVAKLAGPEIYLTSSTFGLGTGVGRDCWLCRNFSFSRFSSREFNP